eukprot:40243-Amorphochlora_amoeboformis.AAC.1
MVMVIVMVMVEERMRLRMRMRCRQKEALVDTKQHLWTEKSTNMELVRKKGRESHTDNFLWVLEGKSESDISFLSFLSPQLSRCPPSPYPVPPPRVHPTLRPPNLASLSRGPPASPLPLAPSVLCPVPLTLLPPALIITLCSVSSAVQCTFGSGHNAVKGLSFTNHS